MSDKTISTLFTGCSGVDLGAKWAGLKHGWGVEYDPKIAQVAIDNGFDTMVADVRDVDYGSLQAPYWLHMSPVCKSFSKAKVKGVEQQLDIECAEACVRAIKALNPPYVSVENVSDYERSKSFNLIVRCLMDEGYNLAWWILNSADYGIAQERVRLVLVASRISLVRKPFPTHQKQIPHESQLSMFDEYKPIKWVGWHETLKGLLPTFPKSRLKPKNRNRANQYQSNYPILIDTRHNIREATVRLYDEPVPAILTDARFLIVHPNGNIQRIDPKGRSLLQSFPITYKLPDKIGLAAVVVGNAVPPLLIQCVIEAQGIHETNN